MPQTNRGSNISTKFWYTPDEVSSIFVWTLLGGMLLGCVFTFVFFVWYPGYQL